MKIYAVMKGGEILDISTCEREIREIAETCCGSMVELVPRESTPAPDEREIAALKSLADVQDNALSQAESLLEQIQEEHRRKHDRADPLTSEVLEYIRNVRLRAGKEGADHG